MRSSRFSLVGAMIGATLVATGAAQRVDASDGDDTISAARKRRAEGLPPVVREPPAKPLTEADNTRLRMAAERRFRRAQKQGRGFAAQDTSRETVQAREDH